MAPQRVFDIKLFGGTLLCAHMKRIVVYLLTIIIGICNGKAVPARPMPFLIPQKDGTSLIVYLRGDEYFHYFASEDDVPILQGMDSSYYYATIKDSYLQRSDILAHNIKERSPKESLYIKQNAEKLQKKIREEWTNRKANALNPLKSRTRQNEEQQQHHLTGTKKGLVILVNFADLTMFGEDVQSDYDMQFNQVGYNQNNHIGSVHDYFYAQSYGAFDLTFDVVGPVTVSKNYSYYGRNNHSENDAHPDEMVYEACLLADEYVNFKDYDWDNDGEVEQVYVIYAGYGESSGAPSNTIWPHQYYLLNNDLHLDGVKIYTYACSCELTGRSGKTKDGIGTACHEFSHCLGLPDSYDVNYTGGYGMSYWDVMCSGSSNGPGMNGEAPCGYTAYERWCLGWLDFTVLDTSMRIKDLPPLDQEPIAYKICNDGNPNEYLVLENRQNIGWHSYVGTSDNAHGLLVYHLDYSESAWNHNDVNIKKNHQRMSVIPADNSNKEIMTDIRTDVFGEMSGVTELTNTSHQSVGGKWFNPNLNGDYYFNQPITNITESDGMISFDFMGGIYVPIPQIFAATEIHKDGFTLNWEKLDEVDSYSVEITEMNTSTNPLEWVLIRENFGVFKTEEGSADGRMDLSIYLDSYTQTAGWKGKRIYTSAFGAKIGTDTEKGYLATPYFRIENNSVTIKCSLYSPMEQNVCISILNERGDTISVKSLDVADTKEFVETFAEVGKDKFRIQIHSDSPFYISSFAAYDGTYTAEKLSSSMLGSIIKPLQSIKIDNIMENQYTISGLRGKKYKYRVKAEKEGAFSKWSDYQEVDVNSTNGISNIPNKGNVISPIIYNMNGVRVNCPTERGIYIYDFGAYRKAVSR